MIQKGCSTGVAAAVRGVTPWPASHPELHHAPG
jgi:hypothetical protein